MAAVGTRVRRIAWLGLLAAIALVSPATAAAPAGIRLSPERVDIGAFYQGIEVALQGEVPPGTEAVVEIKGAATQQELLRKGRRVGLWMTVGEIRVENAPNLYLVLSSTPNLPRLEGRDAAWGFPALQSRVTFREALTDQEKNRFFQEFLELKKSEKLYNALPGTLTISNSPGGQATLKGNFWLPAKVPTGRYQVRLSVVKDGRLLEQKNGELQVRMVGFPALLASLAYQHETYYGVAAVLIAIATGFIMGFLFKGKAEH